MGLLLRPDVYYAKSPEGAYMLTHEGPLNFTGDAVFTLIERVAPYLDGRHELDDLTADLAPERRRLVERLVTALRERGAVREVREAAPDSGAAGPCPHEVSYLGYFREDGAEAFAAYRATTTLVLGSGRLLVETAAAVARSGVARLDAVVAGAPGTELEELSGRVPHDPAGPAAHLAGRAEPPRERLGELVSGAGLVLHVADRPEVERARLLERLCAEKGVPLAQALVGEGAVWLAPVGVSWVSGWRRRTARRAERSGPPGGPAVEPCELAATAAATQLVHGVFRSVTGIGTREPGALTRLDPETLTSQPHAFRAHPLTTPAPPVATEREFLDRVAALAEAPRLQQGDFSRRATSCTGERLGVLGEPEEGDLVQFPLHVCGIEVSDPVELRPAAHPAPTAIGAGTGFEVARHRAALRGFARYGSLMVDPRRLMSRDGDPLCGPDDDPDRVVAALRARERTGRMWAYGLVDGAAYRVDPLRVFPDLGRAAPPPDTTDGAADRLPVGTAAGYGWREAVEAGLLALCHRHTLADMARAATPFPRLDLDTAHVDDLGARYRAMLAAIGDAVTGYDVTGPLGVPTVVCCRAGEPVASAAGLTVTDALRDALERTLLDYQARTNGQWSYAPSRPALPLRLRGTAARAVPAGPPLSGTDLATSLERRGRRPLAVPLDHDPEVRAVMPFAVRVVLADG